MVLDKLGSSLKETLSKIAKSIFVDETLVNELIKDIQRALLQSDVNVKLVFDLSNKIKTKVLKEETPAGLTKKEHLVNVVYEELTNFLGKESHEIKIATKPTKIMLVGLFGSGKTTTTGKLAKYFQKRGYKVGIISTDTWRPAAFLQLKQLGESIKVPVFGDSSLKNPLDIYKKYERELTSNFDIIIMDTAGRDALNEELISELNDIYSYYVPDEVLLIMSADIGQAANLQADTFHRICHVTGVIITKLEGTAKGGGALSACSITGAPVKFIGVGEKIDDLESFDPKRFVGRLLGMGDITGLLEKAKEAINVEDAKDIQQKFMSGKFDLIDLYNQMNAVKKMGPLNKLIEMIPGFSSASIPKEALEVQEEKLKKWKFIMDSCTKQELNDPEIIDSSRAERISEGSGLNSDEVRDLIKQYRQSKKMMKMMKGQNMNKMMRKFKMPQGGL